MKIQSPAIHVDKEKRRREERLDLTVSIGDCDSSANNIARMTVTDQSGNVTADFEVDLLTLKRMVHAAEAASSVHHLGATCSLKAR